MGYSADIEIVIFSNSNYYEQGLILQKIRREKLVNENKKNNVLDGRTYYNYTVICRL